VALACPRDKAQDASSANADHVHELTLWSGLSRLHHTGPCGPKPALDAFAIVVVEGQITAARNN